MSEPTKYASTTKGRQAAAAEIERMAADMKRHGRDLFSIHRDDNIGGWRLEYMNADSFIYSSADGATLDEAYLKALAWPATPPPF